MTTNDISLKPESLHADRERVVQYLRSQLIGPHGGPDECLELHDKPYEKYLMGAVFPIGAGVRIPDDENAGDTGAADDDDDPISLAYQVRPASLGISFFTRAQSAVVTLVGARYEKVERGWQRKAFGTEAAPLRFQIGKANPAVDPVQDIGARLTSVWRPHGDGWLVTVVLSNTLVAEDGRFKADDILYQVGLKCTPEGLPVEAYPTPDRYSWDREEEELSLVYRSRSTFGIGHGTAAIWQQSAQPHVTSVETSFLPVHEVPPITAELDEDDKLNANKAFSMQYLGSFKVSDEDKLCELGGIRDAYCTWTVGQKELAKGIMDFRDAPARIVGRMQEAVARIDKGLALLAKDPDAMRCFVLANRAMHMQMVHSTSEDYARSSQSAGRPFNAPDYEAPIWDRFHWRPFQVAFQLLVIESMVNRNSSERDIVDLIWFPTGGGKTEAYLAVAAFEMFYRRLKYGDAGGGTAVIKRYTLRLLTAQQFERVSALICACEALRQQLVSELGEEMFTLGLWVGEDSTPNSFQKAYELFTGLVTQTKPENPYQLQKCPWCGTRIIPAKREGEVERFYGVRSDQSRFEFFCPEVTCSFHSLLPINVVDDHLYSNPPTFLVGTIDKFARLAWTDRPRAFFTGAAEGERQAPSLIIQDELHLISGPLGTIAGLYEAAMDVVMQSLGARPKYIAATATIRRSEEQVRRLYSRQVSVFPPTGLDSRDSYFSRERQAGSSTPGRLYVGIMGQYHSPVTALVQTSSVLAQAPVEVPLSKAAADGYWTQVIFHNSKRELGKTMTLCRDDIPKRAAVISKSQNTLRKSFEPVEMSANIPSREIPQVLEKLKLQQGAKGAIDYLPCTNMFSVGVDVGRLGLIVMNGQPKTTAEYIQASSRVGRSTVPGLVIAFYPSNKARDRSHYESFVSYHQSLYRAVEPTSVTPYSLPAMERALHAALVIVMRYSGGLLREDDAKRFDPQESGQASAILRLRNRMKAAQCDDAVLSEGIDEYLNKCTAAWAAAAQRSRAGRSQLRYDSRGASNFETLLVQYRPGANWKPGTPWATLNSMRNVDQECRVHVWGESP